MIQTHHHDKKKVEVQVTIIKIRYAKKNIDKVHFTKINKKNIYKQGISFFLFLLQSQNIIITLFLILLLTKIRKSFYH